MTNFKCRAWYEDNIGTLDEPMKFYGSWEDLRHLARHKDYDKDNKIKVMLFTGLKDKYNDCLYAGDIINCFGKYEGIIEWDSVYACWRMSSPSTSDLAWLVNSGEVELIGNIYENPELVIKVEK